jgi:uncharacterized protein (DUF2252 family)
MLASPFAFFRGAAAIMAADLVHTPATGSACSSAAMRIWRTSAFRRPDRTLVFDVNDFDETLPGPWEWDVKRLAASVAVAGRERGFDATERAGAIADGVRGYRLAMRGFAAMRNLDVWYARLEVEPLLRSWQAEGMARRKTIDKGLAKAYRKDNLRAFEKLTHSVEGQPRIVSDPPSWWRSRTCSNRTSTGWWRRCCTACCAPTATAWPTTFATCSTATRRCISPARSWAWAAWARAPGSGCCSAG